MMNDGEKDLLAYALQAIGRRVSARRAMVFPAMLIALWNCVSFAIAAETARVFDIEQQPLASALNQFAQQSDRQILFSTELVDAKRTGGIKGEWEPEAALSELLKGTGLTFRVTTDQTILVDRPADTVNVPVSSSSIRIAQMDSDNSLSASEEQTIPEDSPKNPENRIDLEEIVVTGTNIRGAAPGSSPVEVYDRAAIERSGAATTQAFIQKLPVNFSGGSNEALASGTPNDNASGSNTAAGSGINLRGLGSGSTLVLLNGKRLSPSSAIGDFIDISMIPASALERIEVLTDGASSIYGGDAVAGVVNLILRDSFEGAETSVRYGDVSSGSAPEFQMNQLLGKAWDGGRALVT